MLVAQALGSKQRLEQMLKVIDFRRVEPRFQPCALLLQIFLISSLLCYLLYSVKQVVDTSADPPVETTTRTWKKNLGLWALCGAEHDGPIHGVGTGLSSRLGHTGEAAILGTKVSPPSSMHFPIHNISYNMLQLLHGGLNRSGGQNSVGDVVVHRCAFAGPLLFGDGRWTRKNMGVFVGQAPRIKMHYSIHRSILGWNFGYATLEHDRFTASMLSEPRRHPSSPGYRSLCAEEGMTDFQEPLLGQTSALQLALTDPVVMVHHKQGIAPQFFKLFASMGGFMTCLGIAFTCFFVKKYPDSPVSKIHEARTLVFGGIFSATSPDSDRNDRTHVNEPAPLPFPPGMFVELQKDKE